MTHARHRSSLAIALFFACSCLPKARAQTPDAVLPTSAATAAASLEAGAHTPSPPAEPASEASKLTLDQQVRWLSRAARSGMLAQMQDAELVSLFESLDPLTLPRYLKQGPNGYPSYEFTLVRRERIRGVWPDKPDHMLVRLSRDPLRIYAKWLPDGAHAGQELIYDDSKRPDQVYGHLGGLFGVVPLWASLNGPLARAQSNHSVRDLGVEYITRQFLAEGQKFADAGVTRASRIEVKMIEGARVIAFTYVTPTGQPEFYAKKEILGLDLRRPYFRSVESFDNDGNIFESIVFQTIVPKTFDDLTFDPHNPDYRF
ncbi:MULTISPECIES: DUF1571 domain-containing protein [unclassified Caballeronia]|uniref:DUF1571 domain-containing protein n=1 Tax=unclassified Caballeronia TaxID=2646786 RepID=UPI00285E2F34|nr:MULTISPECIES: DUF1571 domain-containing protein [unclassified Caballeronia]MDR5750896.1 DUF1571 domain-containing protein [Caballeronia sp. LZ024]MDR5842072.1 DUF1571 domain-containing protein [Caballeronia sp. LZ031]